jgi:hypothetical protein
LHMVLWGNVSRMPRSARHPQGQVTDNPHNYSTWPWATWNSYIPTGESFRCVLMGYLLRLTNENSISHNTKIQYSCLHASALCVLKGRVQQVGCLAGIVSACTSKEPATGLSSESTVLWHQWFQVQLLASVGHLNTHYVKWDLFLVQWCHTTIIWSWPQS